MSNSPANKQPAEGNEHQEIRTDDLRWWIFMSADVWVDHISRNFFSTSGWAICILATRQTVIKSVTFLRLNTTTTRCKYLIVRHVFLVESQSAMGHGITRSLFSIMISWMEWAKETDEEILYSYSKEKKVDILLVRFYFFFSTQLFVPRNDTRVRMLPKVLESWHDY